MSEKSQKTVVFLKPSEAKERMELTVPCPSGVASHRMILRRNKATGELFGGCSSFPACSESVQVCMVNEQQQASPEVEWEEPEKNHYKYRA